MVMTEELVHAIHVRPYPGAPRGGDTGLVIPSEDGALAALIDAAGHGLSAYAVAQQARETILQYSDLEPDALLRTLDQALTGTIGAAISIARIRAHTLWFAGIGNVCARVGEQHLRVQDGQVGRLRRTPHLVSMPLPTNTWLVMHTDGVSHHGPLHGSHANALAKTLVTTWGKTSDDASALVMRWQRCVS